MREFKIILMSFSLLAFGFTACTPKEEAVVDQSKSEQAEPQVAVDAATAGEPLTLPELSPEEPKTKLGDLPVAEDLEDEAEKSVNLDNIDLELDRLEAEIDG
jgi:hypothetical protein